MNQLTALLHAIPDAVERHKAEKKKEAEYLAKDVERHRGYAAKKVRASGMTRGQEQAADRAKWLAEVILALASGEPMSTVELGRAMGITRCRAYRRLTVMEEGGHVVREGSAEKTKWRRRADHGR